MPPSPTPNLPLYETDSDFAGETPGESAVAETRSETARTLNTRPGFIEMPKNLDEDLRKLVGEFNLVLEKNQDQLTKNDGWDVVAHFLSYFTQCPRPLEEKKMDEKQKRDFELLVAELHKKIVTYFGSQGFLEASGMNDPRYLGGFVSTLDALTDKFNRAFPRKDVPVKTPKGWMNLPQN
jgi:hypothetical protein